MTQWTQFVRDFRGELEPHLEWYYRRFIKKMQHRCSNGNDWAKEDADITFKEFLKELQRQYSFIQVVVDNNYWDLPDWVTVHIGTTRWDIIGNAHTLAIMHKLAGQRFPKALH